jgi:hypothetical protein
MAIGPGGKYDAQCERVCMETKAEACVVIVLGGTSGSGFSVSVTNLSAALEIPQLLVSVAKQMEADLQRIMPAAEREQ